MRALSRTLLALSALVLLAGAAPALAATKTFTGTLEVNDAPLTIEVSQQGGRIRKVTSFRAGNYTGGGGIPLDCEGIGVMPLVYFGSPDDWRVGRDRYVDADQTDTAMIGLTIEGRFSKSGRRARGTITFDGPVFEKPWYCHTDGALAWSATTG